MKTERQIRFSIGLNREQVPLSDFRCGMITALEWALTPWPDSEPNPDIDHEPELTPEQTAKLFRALEWAGSNDHCIVCRRMCHAQAANGGHADDCIYAEVFYK